MKNFTKVLALGAIMSCAAASQALVFALGITYTGATPGGVAPWVTITITDVAANTVNVRVDHNATSLAPQFVRDVYLNLTPFVSPITISNEVNANKRAGFSIANNAINGAAGNLYDMNISFTSSNSNGGANRLNSGEFWSADLTGTGLSSANFNAVTNNGLFAGAHVQGIAGGQSGHVTVVPEPATMAALGIGVAALIRRKRKA